MIERVVLSSMNNSYNIFLGKDLLKMNMNITVQLVTPMYLKVLNIAEDATDVLNNLTIIVYG